LRHASGANRACARRNHAQLIDDDLAITGKAQKQLIDAAAQAHSTHCGGRLRCDTRKCAVTLMRQNDQPITDPV